MSGVKRERLSAGQEEQEEVRISVSIFLRDADGDFQEPYMCRGTLRAWEFAAISHMHHSERRDREAIVTEASEGKTAQILRQIYTYRRREGTKRWDEDTTCSSDGDFIRIDDKDLMTMPSYGQVWYS